MNGHKIQRFLATILLATLFNSSLCTAQVQTVSIDDKPIWLRQLTRLNNVPDPEGRLTIVASGTVSVYLNGQRLARDLNVTNAPATWKVGSLLRRGRNSLAIAIQSEQAATVGAWLDGGSAPSLSAKNWKTTTAAPPVGWQTTDFNDRDWKPAAVGKTLTAEAIQNLQPRELRWANGRKTSRIRDGHLKLGDNDHVVMLGGTFIERAQSFGYLESAINCSVSGNVTFRNLGWSADTVFAESRGIFDSPTRGYERMIEHVRAEEPDVALVCYGQNEAMSFAQNDTGLERYKQQLRQLCQDLATTGADIVLLSAHPFLDLQKPYPSPAKWNPRLAAIGMATKEVAESLELHYVDLFDSFIEQLGKSQPEDIGMVLVGSLPDHPILSVAEQNAWSDNGMHWNEKGYARVAPIVQSRLTGALTEQASIRVNMNLATVEVENGSVRQIQRRSDDALQFEVQANAVTPSPIMLNVFPRDPDTTVTATMQTAEQPAAELNLIAAEQQASESLVGFLNPDFEAVRQLTIRKNELYFHRWRPQNITYLFGFRKHEQGNNASEIAQFDPLIVELEKQITKAKQAQWHKIIIQEARDTQPCEQ